MSVKRHHSRALWLTEIIATSSKKLILTEAERLQRREEVGRRRKRQMEQKLQDEQVSDQAQALDLRSSTSDASATSVRLYSKVELIC